MSPPPLLKGLILEEEVSLLAELIRLRDVVVNPDCLGSHNMNDATCHPYITSKYVYKTVSWLKDNVVLFYIKIWKKIWASQE